jgi:hypothetical protein
MNNLKEANTRSNKEKNMTSTPKWRYKKQFHQVGSISILDQSKSKTNSKKKGKR